MSFCTYGPSLPCRDTDCAPSSTVGFGALPYEAKVVEALAATGDLQVYIPSVFSTTWEKQDYEDPQFGPVLKFLHGGWDKATELGLPVTPVYTGVFENYFFSEIA